jgi:hypothetical protein
MLQWQWLPFLTAAVETALERCGTGGTNVDIVSSSGGGGGGGGGVSTTTATTTTGADVAVAGLLPFLAELLATLQLECLVGQELLEASGGPAWQVGHTMWRDL